MEIADELQILDNAAKYDVSCSSSGSKRSSTKGQLGSVHQVSVIPIPLMGVACHCSKFYFATVAFMIVPIVSIVALMICLGLPLR